jgi:hypothetical protein
LEPPKKWHFNDSRFGAITAESIELRENLRKHSMRGAPIAWHIRRRDISNPKPVKSGNQIAHSKFWPPFPNKPGSVIIIV